MTEKDKRTYVKVHDGLPDHPKIIEAGGDAGSGAARRLP